MPLFSIRRSVRTRPPALSRIMLNLCCLAILLTQASSCASEFMGGNLSTVTFELSNIFTTCHNPTSSTAITPYKVTFNLWYYTGPASAGFINDFEYLTFSSANPVSSSFNFQAQVFHNGTPYGFEIDIVGTQCARCALTSYDNVTCAQNPNAQKTAYSAGVPMWRYVYGPATGARNFFVNNWQHVDNVSCGCSVNN
jgi:hypothetical protein